MFCNMLKLKYLLERRSLSEVSFYLFLGKFPEIYVPLPESSIVVIR